MAIIGWITVFLSVFVLGLLGGVSIYVYLLTKLIHKIYWKDGDIHTFQPLDEKG